MEAMARDLWTDERLDDLNVRVDRGFEAVDREFIALRTETRTEFAALRAEMQAEFAAVRAEMKAEFQAVRAEMRSEFAAIRGEMSRMRESIDGMQRMMLQLFIPQTVAIIFGFAGLILTRI